LDPGDQIKKSAIKAKPTWLVICQTT